MVFLAVLLSMVISFVILGVFALSAYISIDNSPEQDPVIIGVVVVYWLTFSYLIFTMVGGVI